LCPLRGTPAGDSRNAHQGLSYEILSADLRRVISQQAGQRVLKRLAGGRQLAFSQSVSVLTKCCQIGTQPGRTDQRGCRLRLEQMLVDQTEICAMPRAVALHQI